MRETFSNCSLLHVQGQSRRVQVEVRPVPDSGTMPLIAASILSVSIGDVKVRQMRLSKNDPQWVRPPFFRLYLLHINKKNYLLNVSLYILGHRRNGQLSGKSCWVAV